MTQTTTITCFACAGKPSWLPPLREASEHRDYFWGEPAVTNNFAFLSAAWTASLEQQAFHFNFLPELWLLRKVLPILGAAGNCCYHCWNGSLHFSSHHLLISTRRSPLNKLPLNRTHNFRPYNFQDFKSLDLSLSHLYLPWGAITVCLGKQT